MDLLNNKIQILMDEKKKEKDKMEEFNKFLLETKQKCVEIEKLK